jgi:hypothetical protein
LQSLVRPHQNDPHTTPTLPSSTRPHYPEPNNRPPLSHTILFTRGKAMKYHSPQQMVQSQQNI